MPAIVQSIDSPPPGGPGTRTRVYPGPVTKPCKFIWFGDIHGPEPYIQGVWGRRVLSNRQDLYGLATSTTQTHKQKQKRNKNKLKWLGDIHGPNPHDSYGLRPWMSYPGLRCTWVLGSPWAGSLGTKKTRTTTIGCAPFCPAKYGPCAAWSVSFSRRCREPGTEQSAHGP